MTETIPEGVRARPPGWVVPTKAGTYRANWRDDRGIQRARTFPSADAAWSYLRRLASGPQDGLLVVVQDGMSVDAVAKLREQVVAALSALRGVADVYPIVSGDSE